MYYYISGTLDMVSEDFAVIDCTGVGYKLTVSSHTLGRLSGREGQAVKLYSYFSVKEDSEELFGFFTEEEKAAFCLLITVSGIGPKAAMAILSALTPEKLGLAISLGDVKSITMANGVGRKGAERVILELKDKYSKTLGLTDTAVLRDDADEGAGIGQGSALSDAAAVLSSLGYTRAEYAYALKGLDAGLDCDALVRQALARLMK